MHEDMTFGLWVRRLRRAQDLTQEQLAFRVGCSVVTIRKIESDQRKPSRQIAELLAECLDVPQKDRPAFVKTARGERSMEQLVAQMTAAAHEAETSPLAAPRQPAATYNLPTPPNPLVGRDHELAEVNALLANPFCRLLTLAGPGGVGKTRLALQIGLDQIGQYPDGVWFVPLAPVNTSALILPAIASAIGFSFYGTGKPEVQLLNYLQGKKLLLILDNLEQLVDGMELVSEWLERAAGLQILATSRERLNLQGEWVFEITGLPVPATVASTEPLEQYSAPALFLQSARRVQANFTLAPEERAAVVRICQLVAGSPLGIELAASWVRVLPCREIAAEIERNLDFLSTHRRDVPERHRSLRAVFDHSWNLLGEDERAILRRLSIFHGGFTRPAAEAVAGASYLVLLALVDKSLLRRSDSRYDMHELIWQYAAARLKEEPEEERQMNERHRAYFADWLESLEKPLKSADQPETVLALEAEIDNLRQAWEQAVKQRALGDIARVLPALLWFQEIKSWFQEGVDLLESAVSVFGTATESAGDPAALGALLAGCGYSNLRIGRLQRARELLDRSLTLLRPHGRSPALADALLFAGALRRASGDYAGAHTLLDESLEMRTLLGDPWRQSACMFQSGLTLQSEGRHAEAYRRFDAALEATLAIGDPLATVRSLSLLSSTAYDLGDYAEAGELARQTLQVSTAINDRWSMANAVYELGRAAYMQGDYPEALARFQKSLGMFKKFGERSNIVRVLGSLGEVYAAMRNPSEARRTYREALQIATAAQLVPASLDILARLAALLQPTDPTHAGQMAAAVQAHPASSQEARSRAAAILAGLGEETVTSSTSLEELILDLTT